MSYILGFSAFFHDSSACLIKDGMIVAAAAEERFSRKKHDADFPVLAITYCLKEAGISSEELDEVVFFEKPFTKFERILETVVQQAPKGFLPFRKAVLSWFREKFWMEDTFRRHFPFSGKFSFCQHHLSHAVLACSQSGFENAAYVIIDGVGERACTTYGIYSDKQVNPIAEQRFPHSIGLLYAAFTQYCGFKVNSGEYKLMGLAPYGKPRFAQLIREEFAQMNDRGELQLHLKNFGFLDDLQMINRRFEQVFNRKARDPEETPDQFFKDVAASIQLVTEELILQLLQFVQRETGQLQLVLGGGVALNCVANAQILQGTAFEQVFIHSASGDSGCAMGAAVWAASLRGEFPSGETINEEFLGPKFSTSEIETALERYPEICFHHVTEEELITTVANQLVENKVVGWFRGRMEFGPRALGNRSILASPILPDMKQVLNLKIKKREGFRPFAPVVLTEAFDRYFIDAGYDYSRMLYVAQTRDTAMAIPSCVHKDGTSRVQRLEKDFNEPLYRLLEEMERQTGLPVLINTSFNERGEPVVCTPDDALRCFFNTEMDVLVVENSILYKTENKHVSYKTMNYAAD